MIVELLGLLMRASQLLGEESLIAGLSVSFRYELFETFELGFLEFKIASQPAS